MRRCRPIHEKVRSTIQRRSWTLKLRAPDARWDSLARGEQGINPVLCQNTRAENSLLPEGYSMLFYFGWLRLDTSSTAAANSCGAS